MSAAKYIKQAEAIVASDLSEASVDLRSYIATYKSKRDAKDERAQVAWARAVVKRAAFDGVVAKDSGGGGKKPTKAELLAEIERRNADRDEDSKIVPESEKNADLEAALAADDENTGD